MVIFFFDKTVTTDTLSLVMKDLAIQDVKTLLSLPRSTSLHAIQTDSDLEEEDTADVLTDAIRVNENSEYEPDIGTEPEPEPVSVMNVQEDDWGSVQTTTTKKKKKKARKGIYDNSESVPELIPSLDRWS